MVSASPPCAFLIARSMLSLGIDSALALAMASLRRALASGSGRPCLAAMVMSRDSLENCLERILSCRSLRNWMFLNFEWPAMAAASTAPPAPTEAGQVRVHEPHEQHEPDRSQSREAGLIDPPLSTRRS